MNDRKKMTLQRFKMAYANALKLLPRLTKRQHTNARAYLALVIETNPPRKMRDVSERQLALYTLRLEGVILGLTLVLDATEIGK